MALAHHREHVQQQLNWRYAVKKFDPAQRISEEDWQILKDSLKLSPSSFGLQPWKFALITQPQLKERLVAHSWGQTQPRDCSHLVVFMVRDVMDDSYVDVFLNRVSEVRDVETDRLGGYRNVMLRYIKDLGPEQAGHWMTRQVYIALGQLMATAAILGVDACPMEGISFQDYDLALKEGPGGEDLLGYSTVVACALGYRDVTDPESFKKKVRFDESSIFVAFD
jgi:nitroreductase